MKLLTILSLAALSLVLAACGGSSEVSPTTPAAPAVEIVEKTRTVIPAEATRSGNLWSTGVQIFEQSPYIGDWGPNPELQGVVSFPLFPVPASAVADEAILVLPVEEVRGEISWFGDLLVDAIDMDTDGVVFQPELVRVPDASAPTADAGEEIRVDVTELVQRALDAGRNFADYQLRFIRNSNRDNQTDWIKLIDPVIGGGLRLEVVAR